MIPQQDFIGSSNSIYSKSWIPSPWQIITWGLRQIGLGHAYSGQKLKVGSLTIVSNVEDVAGKVLAEMQKRSSALTDRVMSIDSFREDVAKIINLQSISMTDLSTLLKYLQRDKGVISYDEKVRKLASRLSITLLTSKDYQIQISVRRSTRTSHDTRRHYCLAQTSNLSTQSSMCLSI